VTYVKTFTLYDAWASTIPHAPGHHHGPRVGDECAEPQCTEPLRKGEECYYVVQLPEIDGREQAVCWRHVRPDKGPVS
jgi:hypothetical protein